MSVLPEWAFLSLSLSQEGCQESTFHTREGQTETDTPVILLGTLYFLRILDRASCRAFHPISCCLFSWPHLHTVYKNGTP